MGYPMSATLKRFARASAYARVLYPGPVGEYLAREIDTWRDFGWRIAGSTGRMNQLIDELLTKGEKHDGPEAQHLGRNGKDAT